MLLDQQTKEQIRDRSLEKEKERRFAPEALNVIIERGWFKLFVPEVCGGKMMSLPEALQIFEYAGWVDGSFGWLVTIGAGGGYFAGYTPKEVTQQIFSSPKAVIAGSGTPTGTAVRTEGGYIVSGKWSYCSGADYATTFTAVCKIETNDSLNSETFAIALTPDQVEVVPDWQAFGLKSTNSHSIVVKQQFVPDERTFNLEKQLSFLDEPLYSYPFLLFAQASFAALSIGIAKHLLDETNKLMKRKQDEWNSNYPGRSDYVQNLANQMVNSLHAKSEVFYQTIADSWESHIQNIHVEPEELATISRVCQETSRVALACGQQLIPYLGMTVIMEHERLNQIWRDLQTACQHGLLVSYENEV